MGTTCVRFWIPSRYHSIFWVPLVCRFGCHYTDFLYCKNRKIAKFQHYMAHFEYCMVPSVVRYLNGTQKFFIIKYKVSTFQNRIDCPSKTSRLIFKCIQISFKIWIISYYFDSFEFLLKFMSHQMKLEIDLDVLDNRYGFRKLRLHFFNQKHLGTTLCTIRYPKWAHQCAKFQKIDFLQHKNSP